MHSDTRHPASPPTHTASGTASLIPDPAEILKNGWETDLEASDSVLRNYLATLEDRLRTIAAASDAPTRSTEHAFFVDLDSAYVFDNIVVTRGFLDPDQMAQVIADAFEFFPDDRTWTLQALTPTHDLRSHGLAPLGHPPLMYRPVDSHARPGPVNVDIRAVETADDLGDFERTLRCAYPLPEGSAVVQSSVLRTGFHGFVGYVDGIPVATAGSHTAHGLTEVEWVSTLPSHRGHGLGAALTHAATTVEQRVPAVLVASDDGRPVYERLGFVALIRLPIWIRPGAERAGS